MSLDLELNAIDPYTYKLNLVTVVNTNPHTFTHQILVESSGNNKTNNNKKTTHTTEATKQSLLYYRDTEGHTYFGRGVSAQTETTFAREAVGQAEGRPRLCPVQYSDRSTEEKVC